MGEVPAERPLDLNGLFGLDGRVALVTGGTRGLGRAIAEALGAAGATVVAASRSGAWTGSPPEGTRLTAAVLDVGDAAAVDRFVDEIIDRYGRVDILVNAAGITRRIAALEESEPGWRAVLRTNLDGAFHCSQTAARHMARAGGGRIINVTSMAAHLGFSEVAAYVTSKAGLLGLTRALAVEWAPYGILVNAISPGWFQTAMVSQVIDPEREKKMLSRILLHRYGDLREVVGAAIFLASPAASYITGQVIVVDGGALAYGY